MNLQGFSQILNIFNLDLDSLRLVGDVFWNAWNLLFKKSSKWLAFKEIILMILLPGSVELMVVSMKAEGYTEYQNWRFRFEYF